MSSKPEHPIVVIGAGPAGLAAALALAQNGVPVRVVDKATAFHGTSRGAGIQARTLEVFRILGVLDDIERAGGPAKRMRMYKLPGGTEVEREWDIKPPMPYAPDRPYNSLIVSQYLTEKVLRDHLATYGVHVELGMEPVSLVQDSEGVTVTLKKADGGEEVVRAAYVVGADGAKGMTRKFIGATFEGETRDAEGAVWAECEIEGDGITSEFWHIWSQPGKVVVTVRPRTEGGYHVGFVCSDFNPIDKAEPEKFVEFFHEATGRKDVVFKKIETLAHWRPNIRMVNKFSEGRVFIVGDAAHTHAPAGGQGLNTSVQDSFNLAWKLTLAYKGLAAPSLLATYNAERLPVVAQMLVATTNLYTHAFTKPAADAASANKNIFEGWRDRALTLLEVNYRFSALALDARGTEGRTAQEMLTHAYEGYGPGGGVRAGDRAPDAPGLIDAQGRETSLFAVFRSDAHTILFFASGGDGDVIENVAKEVRAYPTGTVQMVVLGREGVPAAVESVASYHDKDGHAAGAYHVEGDTPTVVIVRPDGYVGAFVRDAAGVRDYFARVFDLKA